MSYPVYADDTLFYIPLSSANLNLVNWLLFLQLIEDKLTS